MADAGHRTLLIHKYKKNLTSTAEKSCDAANSKMIFKIPEQKTLFN